MASVFSGKAGRMAALWTEARAKDQLNSLLPIYEQGWAQAKGEVKQGFDKAKPYIQKSYTKAGKQLKSGYMRGRQDLQEGETQGLGYLDQGLADLNQYYGQGTQQLQRAVSGWDPLIQQNMAGFGMYQNALGLGGEQGRAAAREAFQTGPGYEFQMEEATDAAARAANRYGMLNTGNTTDAVTRLSSEMANKEWGGWVDRLQGFQGGAQNAIAGQTGALTNLAQLYASQGQDNAKIRGAQGEMAYNTGTNLASMAQTYGQNQASLTSNYGENMGNWSVGRGQSLANASTGRMNNIADALNNYWKTTIEAGQQGLMAGQQAAANRMGALTGGLQLAGGFLGKIFG